MTASQSQVRAQFDELKVGDRVEVEHLVTVGQKSWTAKTCGTVVRTERRRQGVSFQRNLDDKVFSDEILLELPDGELTTIAVDEFTTIRRA
jgi:ribosomal protein L19